MYPNRIARVLLGLIALAIFCAYTYYHGSVSPRTRDLTGYSWGMLGHVGELQHILPDSTPQGEITAAEPQEEPSAEAPAVEDPASEEPEASAEEGKTDGEENPDETEGEELTEDKKAVYATTYEILIGISKMIAPFAPTYCVPVPFCPV